MKKTPHFQGHPCSLPVGSAPGMQTRGQAPARTAGGETSLELFKLNSLNLQLRNWTATIQSTDLACVLGILQYSSVISLSGGQISEVKWDQGLGWGGGCCSAASLLRLPPAVMLWGEQSQRYKGTTDAFWDHVYYFNSQTLLSFKAWWISKSIEAKWLIRSLGAPSTVLASLLWSCHTQSDGCCQALLAKHHSLLLAKKNNFF